MLRYVLVKHFSPKTEAAHLLFPLTTTPWPIWPKSLEHVPEKIPTNRSHRTIAALALSLRPSLAASLDRIDRSIRDSEGPTPERPRHRTAATGQGVGPHDRSQAGRCAAAEQESGTRRGAVNDSIQRPKFSY